MPSIEMGIYSKNIVQVFLEYGKGVRVVNLPSFNSNYCVLIN